MSEHKPFVAAETSMREFSVRAVVIGALLGLVFAASSVYLGLKVGLTVSASIPVAVLSITVFRWLGMKGTILENNIAQTTGSAGESIAAGVAFTLPSLLLMGFDMEFMRILLVGLFGGLIGVLMMIPLRSGLIVKEHGKLAYPEGTACADVLVAGEKGGTEATMVFTGFFVGIGYTFLNLVAKLWGDTAAFALKIGGLKKALLAFDVTPPMVGVGYIIGPRVSAIMLGGGLMAFVVLIPLIAAFGGESVAAMSPGKLRNEYILYIGAGAVATGGFIALARAIPTIVSAFKAGLRNLGAGAAAAAKVPRTERDLPITIVLGGAAAIAVAIWLAPMLEINFVTSLLVILFGFFFVTVSSRITGEIGSSSNPISGMTIATLLLTCGLFVVLGSRTSAGLSQRQDAGRRESAAELSRTLQSATDYGYRVQGQLGEQSAARGDARAELQGAHGRLGAEASWNGEHGTLALGAAGGLVFLGGRAFATRPVARAFGLIRVPGVPGVRGYLDNQLVGRTDARGDLVVPTLLPYYANPVSYTHLTLPTNREV
mgnify:CR=1 FL=1